MPGEINVPDTINSGQVFLWKRGDGGVWRGVNGEDVLEVDEEAGESSLDEAGRGFFRLDDDYGGILREISRDGAVGRGVRRYGGLRLLRQDPFQSYISFVVSANSGIPSIRTRLERLCARFGRRAETGRGSVRLFPSPGALAGASQAELLGCGLGYRARLVKAAAEHVRGGRIDLGSLRGAGYGAAQGELLGVPGIGRKVADCIMLFSLERLDAFPLDTWILRALDEFYPGGFSTGGRSMTGRRYDVLHGEAVGRFGRYAGYAQQFLFKLIRDQNRMGWL